MIKKLDDIKISFGYESRDLFGDRMLSSIIRPQVKIPVYLSHVSELIHLVCETLHYACKIPQASEASDDAIISFDEETLKWVTSLQLEAKLFNARAGTQFTDNNIDACDRVRRTAQIMPTALTPLAVFLDQVGKFAFQEQMFIPVPNGVDDFIYYALSDETNAARENFISLMYTPQPGVRTNFNNQYGVTMLAVANADHRDQLVEARIIDVNGTISPEFLADPSQFPYMGLIEFVPEQPLPTPLPFQEIVRRYSELKGRVEKKLANAFSDVDMDKGQGVESQIVFRHKHNDGTCLAWSPRAIRSDALEIGAILGLGFPSPIGVRECAAVTCTIDLAAGLENLAVILTRKLR